MIDSVRASILSSGLLCKQQTVCRRPRSASAFVVRYLEVAGYGNEVCLRYGYPEVVGYGGADSCYKSCSVTKSRATSGQQAFAYMDL